LLKLDKIHQTAELTVPGMQLDLGGIAKGYAADEAIRVLRDRGIRSALYETGGDIVVSDAPLGKTGWEIETVDPDSPTRKKILTLHDTAVSTSGDTVQFVEIDGIRYSHVIDPLTGLGLTDHIMATVIAAKGLVSDPLSKVATILPPSRSDPILKRFGARGFVRVVRTSTTSETNP
jgi:thiamine biosynthesis lipoprotein